MLNPQKRNLVLSAVAVLALIGVIGVVAKKKMGTQTTDSTVESTSDSSRALGTPDTPGQNQTPGQPHLSQPTQPGAEPAEENEPTYARGTKTGQGEDHGQAPTLGKDPARATAEPAITLSMLSTAERARIEKEYPEFKNSALRAQVSPNELKPGEQANGKAPAKGQTQAKGQNKAQGSSIETTTDVSLPKLTLAMLSPAERERIQKKYPELFKAAEVQKPQQETTAQEKTPGTTAFVGPIPTKPGQPLVLLQPGMPGHPDTPVTPGSRGADIAQAPKPEPAVDSCYTVTFHHKHPGMKSGDETCAHHKNLIRIRPAEGLKVNPKTVCIRVNGTPVKAGSVKGKPNDFVIGIVVGMETAVTARYCTGKFRCNEDCKVPKDDFVESIAGSDMDTDESQKLAIAVWDKEDPNDKEANAKLAGEMHKGLKDLDEVAKAAAEGYTLFQDWVPDQQTFACQKNQAQGPAADDDTDAEKPRRKVASKR